VVPHGVLFRGAIEGKIRQQLIEENLLDCVIGLPEKLFYASAVATAILIFRSKRECDDILFVDARRLFQSGKHHNVFRQQDINEIYAACTARKNISQLAYLASKEEVRNNDFNLNIPRYINTFQQSEIMDLYALMEERQYIQAELAELENKLSLTLKEICDRDNQHEVHDV